MLKLAKDKFYDSLLWHRVIPGFVIQGGDPQSKRAAAGTALGNGERPDVGRIAAEIKDEYFHKRGAVGMARDQNPEKASSNCQFYIVVGKKFTDAEIDAAEKRSGHKVTAAQREVYRTVGGTPHLDGGYTVFGEVVEGMDAVDKIAATERDGMDRPKADVRLLKVRPVRKKFLGIF
jgi:peptidyl-prolyl cis-trans isomerase B (cyclophilin B)